MIEQMFQIVPEKLFGKALWRLCACCVVQPSSVGFNMGDIEIIMNLPKEVCTFVCVCVCVRMFVCIGESIRDVNLPLFSGIPLFFCGLSAFFQMIFSFF